MATVYSVFDKVAEEFGPPFVAKNDGIAQRQFQDFLATKVPGHIHGDFSLYRLADWDNALAIQTVRTIPEEVALLDSVTPRKVSLEEVK